MFDIFLTAVACCYLCNIQLYAMGLSEISQAQRDGLCFDCVQSVCRLYVEQTE